MSRPSIQNIVLSENMTLSERHPDSECRQVNWWLYDTRAGWNIVMRAKSREGAMIEAINYWAERAKKIEESNADLKGKVNGFVSQFVVRDHDEGE